jgi:hypothetical protein
MEKTAKMRCKLVLFCLQMSHLNPQAENNYRNKGTDVNYMIERASLSLDFVCIL